MTAAAKYSSPLLVALLAGCATCREHPVACSVAVGLATGAVVIAADRHRSDYSADPERRRRLSPCQPLGVTPCGP